MVSIVNSTFTFKLSILLDLRTIARDLWDSEYNPHRFPSIIMKLRKPSCTCLLSKNGHVVIVGCRSKSEAGMARQRVINRLKLVLDRTITATVVQLRNYVGAGKHTFDLMPHYNKTTEKISHESELFPGVIVKLSGNMSSTVFGGKKSNEGSFFITGAKSMDDLESAYLELLMTF